jgi:antitoxin component of MazEF toxin-antitoxin module
MSIVKVRADGNSLVVTIPVEEVRKTHLVAGDYVKVEADESSGELTITPMQIKPRARYDYREIAREVIAEKRELLERLAAYDRGEEP